jgi:hypothetical protein
MKAIGRVVAMSAALTVGLFVSVPPGSAGAAGPPQFVVPDMTKSPGVLPQDLASADFNTDGNADVAVANLGPDAFQGSVGVLLGDGAGNLGDPILTGLGAQNGAAQVAPGESTTTGFPTSRS